MQCPVCQNVDLLLSERQGVEIDYCPQCRGVWLDRSELDKIIERTMARETELPATQVRPASMRKRKNDEIDYRDDDYDDDRYRKGKPYRKKSVLSEIFDIFD